MARISSKYLKVSLNIDKITKRILTRAENAIKAGAKAWVLSALDNIPVYSGASRASLDKIATAVGIKGIGIFSVSSAQVRLGSAKILARQNQGRDESIGEIRKTKTTISFFYATTLPWLVANELGEQDKVSRNLIKPIPYNFRDKGNIVAQKEIIRKLKGRTIDLRGFFDISTL